MIIVVEGPDNAGKSTLAQQLAKKLKGIYLKSEAVPPTPHSLYGFNSLTLSAQDDYPYVICDRHPFISELIYSSVLRGGTTLYIPPFSPGFKFIYCRPTNETILNTLEVREQLSGVSTHILELINAYDSYFIENRDLQTFIYDYERQSFESVLQFCIQ